MPSPNSRGCNGSALLGSALDDDSSDRVGSFRPNLFRCYEIPDFQYDALQRIKSAAYEGSLTSRYSLQSVGYDAMGNITALKRYAPSGTSQTLADNLAYAYAPGTNRLSQLGDTNAGAGGVLTSYNTYWYTADGSVSSTFGEGSQGDDYRTYVYDEQKLPVRASVSLGASVSLTAYYRYNGSGQRILEKPTSTASSWRRTVRGASGEALAVFDGNGTLKHWNLSGGVGRLDADGKAYYYVADHLGSVRAVVQREAGTD